MPPCPPVAVTITPVNALAYADEIKELFVEHARPEFPEFFDRAYARAIAEGGTSWLGRDPAGRLVMHIACFPHRFAFRGRPVIGGLLVNLMVATPYRAFFPALQLIQRLVQDSKARGDIDFLYADPNDDSRALLRGMRFVQVGTLRRYVLPVGDRRAYLDFGIRLFHGLLLGMTGRQRVSAVAHPAQRVHVERPGLPAARPPQITPQHDESLYTRRLRGYPGAHDWWFTWQRNDTTGPSDAAALVRGPDSSGTAGLHVLRWGSGLHPRSVLRDLIGELRRRGCLRLHVMTLEASQLGRVLRRSGFIPRSDAIPVFAYALTSVGEECVGAVTDWEITDVDCDR